MLEFTPLIASFFVAYVGVSMFGFGLYLLISRFRGTSPWDKIEVRHNTSYQIANKFLPLINLVFWVIAAVFYFSYSHATFANALLLGVLWLAVAAIIDYVGFILIKHPLSVDHKGFYVDQAPWIYLTYFAVFVSPILYVAIFS